MGRKRLYPESGKKTSKAEVAARRAYNRRLKGTGREPKSLAITAPANEIDSIRAVFDGAGVKPAEVIRAAAYLLAHGETDGEAIKEAAAKARAEHTAKQAAQTATPQEPPAITEHPAQIGEDVKQ